MAFFYNHLQQMRIYSDTKNISVRTKYELALVVFL
jgi:hypothetical protein